MKITATMINDYLTCPQRMFLNKFGDKEQALGVSAFSKNQMKKTSKHELEIIKKIKPTRIEYESIEEGNEKTLDLINKKTKKIYHPILMDDKRIGMPDLLRLTDQGYQIVDVKLGLKLKKKYAYQLLFYHKILEKITKINQTAILINGEGKEIEFELNPLEDYDNLEKEILNVLKTKKEPLPVITHNCKNCIWKQKCLTQATKSEDISLLPGMGWKNVPLLRKEKINTLKKFFETNDEKIIEILSLTPERVKVFKTQTKSLLTKKPIKIDEYSLPKTNYWFFDIESHADFDVDYLFGLLNKEEEYIFFLAKNPSEEKKVWYDFIEWWKNEDKPIILHWGVYEKTVFKKLNKKHGGLNQKELNQLLQKCFDLNTEVKKCFALPIKDYGLKTVANWRGFEWSSNQSNGAQSLIWYEEYLGGNEESLKTVIQYNKEDVIATKIVFDWMKKEQ